jgi:hypothetical protein
MSQYKSKISHKPNIFYGDYTERLEDWQAIRNIVNELDNPITVLLNIFQHCPRTKTDTDIYKKDTWLTGWQLIERNEYDLFDISLLVCYTVLLSDNFNDTDVKIHTVYKKEYSSNNHKFNYIIEMMNCYIDVYSMAKLSKSEFDKHYILHYTTHIRKPINTE